MGSPTNEKKCGLFNDPFDYYGHIGSGNGNRLHKLFGERPTNDILAEVKANLTTKNNAN